MVVGFLRAIRDGIFNGYISMVVVACECRGRSIGTALVQQAMDDNDRKTWVLRVGRTGVFSVTDADERANLIAILRTRAAPTE